MEDGRKNENKLYEQKLVRQDLDTFNKAKIQQRQKEVQEALDRDMKILSEFMKSEKEEKESNFRRRNLLRKEMQMYRDHLGEAKDVEKQRQVEIEGWYSREQDRVYDI